MNESESTEILYRFFSNEKYKITTSWVLPNVFKEDTSLKFKQPDFVPSGNPPQYNEIKQLKK